MPYLPPSSPEAEDSSEIHEHHKLYHGAICGSLAFDIPIIPRRRQLDLSSALIASNVSEPPFPHEAMAVSDIERERQSCHYCQLASFPYSTRFPVTITNQLDNATIPSGFTFIKNSILCDGVESADAGFRSGCDCKDISDCRNLECSCLQDMDYAGQAYAYVSSGALKDCLREEVLESRAAIYECHQECSCAEACQNTVVGRGRKVPLDIFRTENRGWGVRSNVNINIGQFVDKYVGEIITAVEAQRRRDASGVAARKDVYLFALDKFSDSNSVDERLRGSPYEVDGEFKSGPTRFINHSCDPNLRIFARVGDYADKHIHDLAFFAIRDIKAGEELTFDYIDGAEEGDLDSQDRGKKEDMTRCLCGADQCRGYLW